MNRTFGREAEALDGGESAWRFGDDAKRPMKEVAASKITAGKITAGKITAGEVSVRKRTKWEPVRNDSNFITLSKMGMLERSE